MPNSEEFSARPKEELIELATAYAWQGAEEMSAGQLAERLDIAGRLSSLRLKELRERAGVAGLERVGGLRKSALIGLLVEAELQMEQETDGEPEAAVAAKPEARPDFWHVSVGWVMRLLGGAGVGVSLIGALIVPVVAFRLREPFEGGLRNAQAQVAGLVAVLDSAGDGLGLAADSLRTSSGALNAMEASVGNTLPLLESIGGLLGGEAPDTIEATRRALFSAQEGAAAIDQVLRGLSLFGGLTGVAYDPDEPLQDSFGSAAQSLEPLPRALRVVSTDLQTSGEDLGDLQTTLADMATDLDALAESLAEMQTSLQDQSMRLSELADSLGRTADRAPLWLSLGTIILIFLFAWMALTQYAVYHIGGQIAGLNRESGPDGSQ